MERWELARIDRLEERIRELESREGGRLHISLESLMCAQQVLAWILVVLVIVIAGKG